MAGDEHEQPTAPAPAPTPEDAPGHEPGHEAGHEAGHRHHSHVALTLAAAAVVAALLGARAAVLFDHADGEQQSAVRTEVKRGAAIVEDVRFVYQAESPTTYRYVRARAEADALAAAATAARGKPYADLLQLEAESAKRLADALISASETARTPRYAVPGGGFNLGRRLADQRNENPALVKLDPDELARGAERSAWHASLDVAATLGPALAFMLAAFAQAFVRRRRLLLPAAWLLLVAGLAVGIAWEVALP